MSKYGFQRQRRNLVWQILLFPITIFQKLAESSGNEGMQGGPRGVGGWLYLIFLAPFVWLGQAFVHIFVGWSASRRGRSFLYGIPALVFGLGMLGVFLIGGLLRSTIDSRYYRGYVEAMQSDQIQKASLYIDRAIRENPEKAEFVYQKAQLLIKDGKTDEAYRLIQTIATPEKPGFGKAHLLIANTLIKNFQKTMKVLPENQRLAYQKKTIRDIESHLKHVINDKSDPRLAETARFRLYRYLYALFRFKEAAPLADQLVAKNYGIAAEHYQLFSKVVKNQARADSVAEKSSKKLREEIIAGVNGSFDRWKQLWKVYLNLEMARGKYDQAWGFLNQFLTSRALSEEKLVHIRLSGSVIKLRHSEHFKKTQPEKGRRARLTMLSQALRLRPGFPAALTELVDLGFSATGPDSDQWIYDAKADANPGDASFYAADIILGLRALYEGDEKTAKEYFDSAKKLDKNFPYVLAGLVQAVEGNSEVTQEVLKVIRTNNPEKDLKLRESARFGIQSMLANHAVRNKDFAKAVKFYRQAVELNPEAFQSQNNLAFCLIHLPDAGKEQFEEALKLSNEAIAKMPSLNNFYETRGNVHMQLGNYREAVADFEKALDLGYARAAKVWPLLAEANRKIGRDKQAAAYQRKWDAVPEATRKALKDLYFSGNNEKLLPGEKPNEVKVDGAGSDSNDAEKKDSTVNNKEAKNNGGSGEKKTESKKEASGSGN